MATTQLQLRRGNTASISAFTGALAEVIYDTDEKTLVVQDGSTSGGFYLAQREEANAAFNLANSANVLAQSAYNSGNATLTYATSSFNKANAANVLAQSAYANGNNTLVLAQSAYANGNNTFTFSQSAYNVANSSNTVAFSAYDHANTAYTNAGDAYNYATSVDTKASAAFNKANAANVLAQSAYNSSNTKFSSSGGTISGNVDITGQANVSQRLTIGTGSYTVLPNLISQFTGNSDYYSQINQQNLSGNGSGDIVVTADNGTDQINFIDMGMAGSVYDDATPNAYPTTKPNDGYLYLVGNPGANFGGNLVIGTAGSGSHADISFVQGTGYDESARLVYGQGLVIETGTVSSSNNTGALVVRGGVGVQGAVHADAVYDGTVRLADVQTYSTAGFNKANTANVTAQNAYNLANTANVTAQAGFDKANAAYDLGSSTLTYATSGFNKANAANVLAQSSYDSGNNTMTYATAGFNKANAANVLAQAAYDNSNTKFNSSGGTISGDTVVTGNLTVTGTTFYANTKNVLVEDNIITLNSNVTGTPTLNAGIEVNRGNQTNTSFVWNETNKDWEFTNDGTNYKVVADAANVTNIGVYANSGITLAQSSYDLGNATATYATAGFNKANAANVLAQSSYDSGNNTMTYATAGFNKANAANVLAQSAYDSGNNTLTYATSGFNKANAANVLAQSAYDFGNTVNAYAFSAYSHSNNTLTYATAGFDKANAANVLAQSAYDSANNVFPQIQPSFNKANAANVLAQSAYDSGNNTLTYATAGFNKANAANILAQSSYDKGNTTLTYATAAFDKTNSSYNFANSVNTYAFSAYASSNTKATVYNTSSAPTSAQVDDIWIDTNSGIEYVNISSNSAVQWVEFGPLGTPQNVTANLQFADQTIFSTYPNRDITVLSSGTGNILLTAPSVNFSGNIIANVGNGTATFNNLKSAYFRVNTATIQANSAAINIVGSNGYYTQQPTSNGYMMQITGLDNTTTRVVIDAASTDGSAYSAFVGRKARGTHQNPTAAQSGDILAKFTGNGYGTSGYGVNAGGASVEMHAIENYTDTSRGASLVIANTDGFKCKNNISNIYCY